MLIYKTEMETVTKDGSFDEAKMASSRSRSTPAQTNFFRITPSCSYNFLLLYVLYVFCLFRYFSRHVLVKNLFIVYIILTVFKHIVQFLRSFKYRTYSPSPFPYYFKNNSF